MVQIIRLILVSTALLFQSVFAAELIDSKSALIIDKGYKLVEKSCSTCHSLKLVTKNTASRKNWLETIQWMQREQGMPVLSKQNEKLILDYLAKNYAPHKKGRRLPLSIQQWTK